MVVITQSLPSPGNITFDNASANSTTGQGASPTPLTWSHNNIGGNFLVVPVFVAVDANSGFSVDITYGGEELLMAESDGLFVPITTNSFGAFYYLEGAPKGNNTVSAELIYTNTPNQVFIGGAVSYSGVGGVGQLFQTTAQTTEIVTQSVSSNVGKMLSQFFFTYNTSLDWTPTAYNQTSRVQWTQAGASGVSLAGSISGGEAAGGPSVNFSGDMNTGDHTIGLCLELLPG